MIEGLGSYPSYGLPATPRLGAFPTHWKVNRAKVLLREIDERSETGDEELLSVSHKTGVTPRREKTVSMFLAESAAGHKLCRPGDVVVNTMWAWMAAVGVSWDTGLVSPSYAVYRPRRPGELEGRFLDELLRTPRYRDEYLVRSTGITSSRLRLYPDEFLTIPVPVPPLDEQNAIGRFLDDLDQRIRRYVDSKQALIAALAERRDAITRDATKVAEAQSVRLRVAADKIERPIPRNANEIYTPVGLYNRGRGIFHKPPSKGTELGDSTFFWIAEDDLVLSGQFAWEGAIALATDADAGCVASHRYAALRGKPGAADSGYLLAFFKTDWGQLLLSHHSRGAAGRNRPLNVASLMKEKVPLPPMAVQTHIGTLVRLEARLQQEVALLVALLLEYRARLASDVVTGRLDVREAASALPDLGDVAPMREIELSGTEPLDDADLDELEEVPV